MALALVTVFADEARQVQVFPRYLRPKFLLRLAASARVGRLAGIGMKLAAARAPQAQVRLLEPLHQQHLVPLIETVQQRRNDVRQRHARSGSETDRARKLPTKGSVLNIDTGGR